MLIDCNELQERLNALADKAMNEMEMEPDFELRAYWRGKAEAFLRVKVVITEMLFEEMRLDEELERQIAESSIELDLQV